MKTLNEAKAYVAKHAMKGVTCPCCGQYAKVYRLKINRAMALALMEFYRVRGRVVHVPTTLPQLQRSRVYPKLAHWGLLAPGSKSGFWRITEKGCAFVDSGTKAPAYVFLYNGKKMGEATIGVTIEQALKENFNLKELLEKAT